MSGSERPPSLMIVDDNRINLTVLKAILSSQGYEVIAYKRKEDALEAAVQNPPDLILLDIMMPDMDGFEVCRRLKEDWLLQKIPVIFISALGDSKNKLKRPEDLTKLVNSIKKSNPNQWLLSYENVPIDVIIGVSSWGGRSGSHGVKLKRGLTHETHH